MHYGFATPVTIRRTCAAVLYRLPQRWPVCFATSYTSEPYSDATNISGAGTKIAAATRLPALPAHRALLVINSFYVDANTLFCKGNAGAATPQPLLNNVGQYAGHVRHRYGQSIRSSAVDTDATIAGAADNPNGNFKWAGIAWSRLPFVLKRTAQIGVVTGRHWPDLL